MSDSIKHAASITTLNWLAGFFTAMGYHGYFSTSTPGHVVLGRQATYEKELRELREKLAKRQAYLEEGGKVLLG